MEKKEKLKQLLLKKKKGAREAPRGEEGGKPSKERQAKGEKDIDSRFVETIYDPR